MFQFLRSSYGLLIVASVIYLVGLVQYGIAEAPPEDPNDRGPFDCFHLTMRSAKSIMKNLTLCSREVKANSSSPKDFSDKLGCIMKCVMKRINFTNDHNALTKESMMSFIRNFWKNNNLVEGISQMISSLCTGVNAIPLDLNDDKCVSYGKLAVCMQSALGEFIEKSEFCIHKSKAAPSAVI